MKKTRSWVTMVLLLFIGTACMPKKTMETQPDGPLLTIKQLPNQDYSFAMGDGILEAVISPLHGSKLISLKYAGKEVLSPSSTDSLNYGSTFWPSPQNWDWPPAREIDRAKYPSEIVDNVLIMRGQVIKELGMQFIKRFTLQVEDTSVQFEYQIVNVSSKEIQVAPWEVTRVAKGGLTFFPIGQDYPAFEQIDSGIKGSLYYCVVPSVAMPVAQKINFDGEKGWLAHVNNGILLVKKFKDIPSDEFAPKEGDVEIYIDDNTDYIELENQGAYVHLMPGDTAAYQTTWLLRENDTEQSVEGLERLEKAVNALLKM